MSSVLTVPHRAVFGGLLALSAILTPFVAGCDTLDGKAERHLLTTEPTPTSVEIQSRFLDVNVSVVAAAAGGAATAPGVTIDASVYLATSGGHATAEREIEALNVFVVRDGSKLVIRQGEEGTSWSFAGMYSGRGHITVALPPNVPVSITSASGDISIKGDFGAVPLDVRSASGDLVATDCGASSFTARTASGDARVTVVRPLERLSWSGASGDLTFTGGALTASAETASGDLRLEGLTGAADASSASGDVLLRFAAADVLALPSTRIKVATASGDVKIVLPASVVPGGSLTTASGDFSVAADMPKSSARRTVTLTGPNAAVECATASGDVTLTR